MKSTKIIFGLALIAFCYISQITCVNEIVSDTPRKCFVCDSKDSCKKPKMYECNKKLASETLSYLQKNHTGVDPNTVSANYECFREYIYTSLVYSFYMGCINSNIIVCELPLVPYNSSSLKAQECYQCGDRDGCNPAGRINIDVMTSFSTIMVAVLLRSMWL